ncbi:hypothetical protein [Helicovermis profundi]|uniref:Uncharacterized protein n=1 Tax=Helicovermis profundi TaxID=3065157 RepID=A0AAU9EK61_9FIRM|nr:hypothetical protein HLPR_06950 [Clostridia bacterium S502]
MFNTYKILTNEIHDNFNVNISLCKIIGRRWSFVYEAGNFTYGNNHIIIDENYGLIVECSSDISDKIKEYISK